MIDFLCQIEILLLNMLKISGYSKLFSKFFKFQVFSLNCPIPGFPDFLATLITTLKRYCKATLNVFFNKKVFDEDNKLLSI